MATSIRRTTPPGTTDTHLHIYEPGHAQNPYGPPPEPAATLADYRAEMARLGIDRAVVVQPSAYGTDNSCTLAAVAALGPAARGVAILPETVTAQELDLLSAQGVVSLRCLMSAAGMMDWERTRKMAGRVTERGWHLDLQFDGRELPEREAEINALPGTLVFDHLGRLPPAADPDGPEARVLLRLLETGRVWIKLSGPYYVSRRDDEACVAASAWARRLVVAAPDRCLWGSNWPHPQLDPRPDNAWLLDLMAEWAPDEATRCRILADNPALLYGFDHE